MNDATLAGAIVDERDLTLPMARAVARVIKTGPFTQLIECRKLADNAEVVIFNVEVELGQYRVHDVRRCEPLAVRFAQDERIPPEILALRADFPKVPHLNLRAFEYPRSLCIFEGPYAEYRLDWTPEQFVRQIREWLAQTAKGILHGEDQPLEPLLPYSVDQLVVPDGLFSANPPPLLTIDGPIVGGNGLQTFIARPYRAEDAARKKVAHIALALCCEPQTHGVIDRVPQNLSELHTFMLKGGVDLLEFLREQVKADLPPALLDAHVILVVGLPMTRNAASHVEAAEIRAFLLTASVQQLRVEVGVWGTVAGSPAGRLLEVDTAKNGDGVEIRMLNPHIAFTPDLAAACNGNTSPVARQIALAGVGAIGSHLLMNLVRMGQRQWAIIDSDILLPHNLARHVLPSAAVGHSKAQSMARMVNELFDGAPIAYGVIADLVDGTDSEELLSALKGADIIVDAAASIAVSRALVHDINSPARRVSVFLNPAATDLVMIAEDTARTYWLDSLEMQYYRGLVHTPDLHAHLVGNDSRVRYANSCRDISATVPQDLVALNGAIASKALGKVFTEDNAAIWVWHTDSDSDTTTKTIIDVAEPVRESRGEWTIVTDQHFLDAASVAREKELPNETGGILIGSYDMSRKIIYVVDTILSPPDSLQWPTVYVRGYQGLTAQLEMVTAVTAGRLTYVGEWHSHPSGSSIQPSHLDRQAYQLLTQLMRGNGQPPLMLIVGQNHQHGFYLDTMDE